MRYFYLLVLLKMTVVYGQTPGEVNQLFKNHDYAGTIAAGRACLQMNADDPEVYRLMSKSFHEQKKLDSAIYFWEKAFAFDSVFSPHASIKFIAGTLGRLRRLAEMHIEAGDTALGISELYTILHILPPGIRPDSTRALLVSLGCDPDSTFRTTLQWQIIKGKHIDYYFEDTVGIHALLPAFINRYEGAFDTLDSFFHADLNQRIRCFVYTGNRARKELGKDLAANAHPNFYQINTGFFGYPAGHEITRILVVYAWGKSPDYTDRFINEGLAVAFDLDGDRDKMEMAKQVFAGNGFSSVREVWEHQNTLEKNVLYPVAGAFVQYLYQHGSASDFKRLVKRQTMLDAMSIYGKDNLKKLMHDFDKEAGLVKE